MGSSRHGDEGSTVARDHEARKRSRTVHVRVEMRIGALCTGSRNARGATRRTDVARRRKVDSPEWKRKNLAALAVSAVLALKLPPAPLGDTSRARGVSHRCGQQEIRWRPAWRLVAAWRLIRILTRRVATADRQKNPPAELSKIKFARALSARPGRANWKNAGKTWANWPLGGKRVMAG